MPEVRIVVNGDPLLVAPGTTVAAALLRAGIPCRTSVQGEPRTALCGMGICFECRATVNGRAQQPMCLIVCAEGMVVETSR